jgi:hypothetical protein
LAAFAADVSPDAVPRNYALRGEHLARLEHCLAALGFMPIPHGNGLPGDILVAESGPQQVHLAVISETGLVHADAKLGRVAERPGEAPWPVRSIWRLSEVG